MRTDIADASETSAVDDGSYYREARSWERTRVEAIMRSERRAWIVALSAILMAIASLAALAALTPLKQAVPFLVYVDRFSGNTEVREAMNARVQFSDILDKHWVMQYVIGRERYDWNLLQSDYERILAMSGPTPSREYRQLFDGPGAIHKTLGRTQEYAVNVLSVSLAPHAANTSGVATVRFDKIQRNLETGIAVGAAAHYVATIGYEYQPSVFTTEKKLIVNPLGFVVTTYRVDPELTESVPHAGGVADQQAGISSANSDVAADNGRQNK
ncbi:virB8 family protein [Burkholderia territorii]|uniref:virB8 family protein n=1 Tax=Burkholderia territorii TaxID=1503055 RepID=UPI0009BFDBC5|nr:type IV secretion system protein [Burkholderia territorii]